LCSQCFRVLVSDGWFQLVPVRLGSKWGPAVNGGGRVPAGARWGSETPRLARAPCPHCQPN